ncbi:hypothetical protein GF386_00225 [Candidatus Pacearchaeota archaeon]|nr:hypothetical protein [Candidatus Pacearchaeota archaeon]MBD3282708.1 hypothetical protein [Candidatus Pacearchaeota archaeon]
MKKRAILVLLILIPFVNALDVNLYKGEYFSGETLQAEIKGNFLKLTSENVLIYEEGIPRPEPVQSDLIKYQNRYYYYALLPNKKGNFSLRIQNAIYTEFGELKSDEIKRYFKIIPSNKSVISINPGFVITNDDFSVDVRSFFGDSQVNANFNNQTRDFYLIEDVEKKLSFSVAGINKDSNVDVNGYSIPVFILSKTEEINETVVENHTEIKKLEFQPTNLTGKIIQGKEYFFEIALINKGDNLSKVVLSNNMNITVIPDYFSFIEKNKTLLLNLTIPPSYSNVSGEITAQIDNNKFSMPILLGIVSPNLTNATEVNETTSLISCYHIGIICDYDEICNGSIKASLEGPCCIGNCIEEEKSNYSWIVGVVLIAIILIAVYFFYRKSKKSQKPKSSKELLKEKSDLFKERMKKPGEQVTGSLGKV